MISDNYKILIDNLTAKFGARLKAVVLFGSHARGQAHKSSDHDIFLIIENLPFRPLERLREVRSVVWDLPFQVNFIAKTPEEFEKDISPLIIEIGVDGVCLFGKSYFSPYQKRIRELIQEAGLEKVRAGKDWYWKFKKVPQKEWEITWEGYREFQ